MLSPTWLLSLYAGFAVIGVAAILISIVSESWIEYQVIFLFCFLPRLPHFLSPQRIVAFRKV